MRSKRSHEGYLLIDHSASPGVPEAMARQAGLDPSALREGQVFESACYTCSHCQAVVVLNPARTRERAYCRSCDHYICDSCGAAALHTGCQPIAKTLEIQAEASQGRFLGDLTHGQT